MTPFDHIVVGGGISGMTAALLLGRRGQSVAIVEASPQLAPIVRGFRRKRVQFDTGMHILGGLGQGHPLNTYLSHMGIMEHLSPIPFDPACFDTLVLELTGHYFDMACGFDAFRSQLVEAFPHEKSAIETYVEAVQTELQSSPFLNFSQPFDTDAFFAAEMRTVDEFISSITDNDELKTVLTYQSVLYGVTSDEALFSNHAMVAGSYILSAHTLKGGGASLAKAYESELNKAGVTVICNSHVTTVETHEKTVTAITLSTGERLATSSCIWTPHPSTLLDVMDVTNFRPAFRKRLSNLQSTPSAFMLFGVSDSQLPGLENRNIISLVCSSIDESLQGTTPPENSVLYLTSIVDPDSGKTAVTVTTPCLMADFPERGKAYDAYKETMFADIQREVFRRFPGLEANVTFIEGATPRTFQDYSSSPDGTLYGLKHSINQYNPAPVTKVKGLLLAGQSIVAPGILGAIVSAYLACGFLLGHETMQTELRTCK